MVRKNARTTSRRRFMGMTGLATGIALAGCNSSGGSGGGGAVELRMSTSQTLNAPIVQGFEEWGSAVSSATDGEASIEVFPSNQLGSDEDVIEQALAGVNVAVLTDGARLADYVKDIGIIHMPYVTDSYEEVEAIVGTEAFAALDEELREQGIRILAYNWYDGPRNFYTNSEVNEPADLNGLRIRTPGAPAWSVPIQSLGATPVSMDWGETYNGIQSGALDGLEAQSTSTRSSSIHEVTSIMTRTEHTRLANFVLVGEQWAQSVPEDVLTVIAEECTAAAQANAQEVIEAGEQFEQEMVDEGLTINEVDKAPFIEAAEAAYDELGYGEIRDTVWSEIGKSS